MLAVQDGSRLPTPRRHPCFARRLRIPARAANRQTTASTFSREGRGSEAFLPLRGEGRGEGK